MLSRGIFAGSQDGGDSRLRGNDGRGRDMTGGGDGNGGTQRRKDAMKSRRGAKGYGTVSDATGCSASEKMFLR